MVTDGLIRCESEADAIELVTRAAVVGGDADLTYRVVTRLHDFDIHLTSVEMIEAVREALAWRAEGCA